MSNDEDMGATLAFAGVAAAAAVLWKAISSFQGDSDKNDAERLYNQGVKFGQMGMYQQAFDFYSKCLEKNPDHAYAYNNIAWDLAIHNQDLNIALQYAGKAIQLSGNAEDRANFYGTLAEIHGHLGNFDEAIVAFKTCLSIDNTIDQYFPMYNPSFRLALCYWLKQDMQGATYHITNALKINSPNPHVYSLAGDICIAQERYSTAIAFYLEAIQRASQWNFMYPILGDFDTTAQRQFFVFNVWINIAVCHYHNEDYEKSWDANVEAYKINSLEPVPLINLASLWALKGNKSETRRFLEMGIPLLDPNRHAGIISFMRTHPNFEPYRDIVLNLLLGNGKITRSDFVQHQHTLVPRSNPNTINYNNNYTIKNSNIANWQQGSHNTAADISADE